MRNRKKDEEKMDRNGSILQDWREKALALEKEIAKVIIGQERVVRLITTAIFARGHVLLEGDVGVGKTTLLRAFARAIGGAYERIEGTIDLMPNDLIYYTYISEEGKPRVDPGPLLKNGEELAVFFFNEINRARPQVHSLMLRVMAEKSANAFNREYRFPHLIVFADRNRVEKEETFEISSAARDRFMLEVLMETPKADEDRRQLVFDPRFHDVDSLIEAIAPGIFSYADLNPIAELIQQQVAASEALQTYALNLWSATKDPEAYGVEVAGANMKQLILAGASPRGMSMILRAARVTAWLSGRNYLLPEDIQSVFFEAIAHRIFFNPIYELRRATVARELVANILNKIAAP
ncbi:MAG: AAA family ATPase [Burkholderiales bacterium]